MEKIILTEQEIQFINKHLRGEIEVHSATEEEMKVLGNVIEKANAKMEELDAYDEALNMDFDLLGWYLSLYEKQ